MSAPVLTNRALARAIRGPAIPGPETLLVRRFLSDGLKQ
jgi:hypothetical protein